MFFFKTVDKYYKLDVFGSCFFLVHPDFKDLRVLFNLGEFLIALLSFNV